MRVLVILFGLLMLIVAILTFVYGVFGLISIELASRTRIDPMLSVGWLLVSFITGSVAARLIKEDQ